MRQFKKNDRVVAYIGVGYLLGNIKSISKDHLKYKIIFDIDTEKVRIIESSSTIYSSHCEELFAKVISEFSLTNFTNEVEHVSVSKKGLDTAKSVLTSYLDGYITERETINKVISLMM